MPQQYTTINGHEKYNQINQEDFKVDLKKFIDAKSNKIKFKLSTVLKLLPYDGFYPQERTKQIAGIFNNVFIDATNIAEDKDRVGEFTSGSDNMKAVHKTMALTQPLFSPGILFNTIKAGIAVDWPMYLTTKDSSSISNIYVTSSDCRVAEVLYPNYRLPFEALLAPDVYYKRELFEYSSYTLDGNTQPNAIDSIVNKTVFTYLDPTIISSQFGSKNISGYAGNESTHIILPQISGPDIIKMAGGQYKQLYYSAINNFLYETANFFLKDGQLTNFKSSLYDKSYEIPIISQSVYAMDLVIKKSPNFSMFSDYNYSSSYGFVNSSSLFGPPVRSNVSNTYFHDTPVPYQPYTPPYYRDGEESRITVYYSSSANTSATLQSIIENSQILENKTYFSFIENVSMDIDDPAYKVTDYQMTLKNCLNTKLLSEEGDKHSWYIQTKFETPLINFDKCSYVKVRID